MVMMAADDQKMMLDDDDGVAVFRKFLTFEVTTLCWRQSSSVSWLRMALGSQRSLYGVRRVFKVDLKLGVY